MASKANSGNNSEKPQINLSLVLAEIEQFRAEMRRFDVQLRNIASQLRREHQIESSPQRHNNVPDMSAIYETLDAVTLADLEPKPRNKFSLNFDVKCYKPEEVQVTLSGSTVHVHARHEEPTQNGHIFREINRQHVIPEDVNIAAMKTNISCDGVLTIEAPYLDPQSLEDVMSSSQKAKLQSGRDNTAPHNLSRDGYLTIEPLYMDPVSLQESMTSSQIAGDTEVTEVTVHHTGTTTTNTESLL